MSIYMAFMLLQNDSFQCVLPNEIELCMKVYKQNDYYNISISSVRNMMAYTRYSFDENNKPIIKERDVEDYNVMIGFKMKPDGTCKQVKRRKNFISGIPDNAVRLDHMSWPQKLPGNTENWRYNWLLGSDIVVAVERIQYEVCIPRAKALFTIQGNLITDSMTFAVGNYSLTISNKKVFEVPPECVPVNGANLPFCVLVESPGSLI